MSILDRLLERLVPHECLGCAAEGQLLCADCQKRLSALPERCYRCRKLSPGGKTCLSCRSSSCLYRVRAATVYDGLAKDIIWKLKFTGMQSAAAEIARHVTPLLPAGESPLIVHAPTATGRIRQRGYDQAELVAAAVARFSHLRHVACLVRLSQAHQVGANRRQRLAQLERAFRVSKPKAVRGAHIVLIDDVLTTGSTLEAAAATLRAAGARRVDALVFAQA